MPEQISAGAFATLGGRTFTTDQTTTGENIGGSSPVVTAAKAGSLTTRTDADTGTITGSTGHGVVDGDKLDVYWSGGCRRNMTVGTVSGNAIPIDGGSGDNLPALNTALTFKVPQTEGEWALAGADVRGLCVKAPTYRGQVVVRQSGGTEIAAFLVSPGHDYVWSVASGITNPVTGATIAKATFSHESPDADQEMVLTFIYN